MRSRRQRNQSLRSWQRQAPPPEFGQASRRALREPDEAGLDAAPTRSSREDASTASQAEPGSRIKPNWAMRALTYGARQLYLKFKIRVRQWGHLPAERGATVLITNHQHMDEGETITARTFFLHPWKPLVMCNSRRTFETGFIAARLPWSARFTRGLNLSGLWARYSILPIENHLHSRPLISLAEELMAAHGDLSLEAILPAETVASLGLEGCVLSDLWKLANFDARSELGEGGSSQAALPARSTRETSARSPSVTSRPSSIACEPEQRFTLRPKATSATTAACVSCARESSTPFPPLPISGCARSLTTLSRTAGCQCCIAFSLRRRRRSRHRACCGAAGHELRALGHVSGRRPGDVHC